MNNLKRFICGTALMGIFAGASFAFLTMVNDNNNRNEIIINEDNNTETILENMPETYDNSIELSEIKKQLNSIQDEINKDNEIVKQSSNNSSLQQISNKNISNNQQRVIILEKQPITSYSKSPNSASTQQPQQVAVYTSPVKEESVTPKLLLCYQCRVSGLAEQEVFEWKGNDGEWHATHKGCRDAYLTRKNLVVVRER